MSDSQALEAMRLALGIDPEKLDKSNRKTVRIIGGQVPSVGVLR